MLTKKRWAGAEVPIIGLDSLKWHQVFLPPSDDSTSVSSSPATPIAPLTKDAASCNVIGDPPTYLIWRIHKDLPHALELLELNADKELPRNGLRIVFPVALCPFAFICKDEISCTPGNSYLLYALTITGVAYLIKLWSLSTYLSYSVIPKSDIIEFNLQTYPNFGEITAVGATPECLLVGKNNGSVCIFQLGMIDQTAPGFMRELRGEAIGRFWGVLSRNRMAGAVLDLVISEVNGRQIVFVLHIDCVLQAWDISSHRCVFCDTMSDSSLSGATPVKLWLAKDDCGTLRILLSILYKDKSEPKMKKFMIDELYYRVSDRINLSLIPSSRRFLFYKGEIIDMKVTPKKIWLLTEGGIILYHLLKFFAE